MILRNYYVFILFALLTVGLGMHSQAQSLNFSNEKHADFPINPGFINKEGVQFNLQLIDKNKKPLIPEDASGKHPENMLWYSGLNGKAEKEGAYYQLSTKVAFVSPLRTDFYTEERITDPEFIQASMKGYKIQSLGSNHFKVEGNLFSPSFQFMMKVYNPESHNPEVTAIMQYLEQHQADLGRPSKVVIQKNYNYGRVLMHKTTENSYVLTLYYPWQRNQTLIVNYTLNLLHNIPPKFLGGPETLRNEMQEGIANIVDLHKNMAHQRQLTKNNP